MVRVRPRVLAVLPVALAFACATGHRRGSGANYITVRVQNDLIPASAVVVHMIGDGRRVLLGDVPPATDRSLTFRETTFRGMYSLEARTRAATVQSQSMNLRPGDTIIWQLRSNLVQIHARGSDSLEADSTGTRKHTHGTAP